MNNMNNMNRIIPFGITRFNLDCTICGISTTSAALGSDSNNGSSNNDSSNNDDDESSKNSFNIPFTDSGEARLILPSVNDRMEFIDVLKRSLYSLSSLSSLESNENYLSYKLEYCLYLHTNDRNKELM